MVIDEWARLWGIPANALTDLRVRLGIGAAVAMPNVSATDGPSGSETRQQALIRLDAIKHGVWLTRNNVGALLNPDGVPVRYGLANESKGQNQVVKSGDLIGIRSILIGPQHMGMVIGQFVSREAKHQSWQYKGDKHEVAQLNWCDFVNSKGGDAAFATGPGSFNYNR